ncbi:uncharacterized protein LOC128261349 [Drosophila gunungcola]|uniref:uncharacterized protein LOC128261349 n=1 Tax=Drosophila gunungcola TaxID=103775 RepID=UPI0022DED3E3|nr:uncharacterized protein LOC128261349 [Drosophila gunungcola]
MEMVHTAIGVAGTVALLLVVSRSVSQVAGLVADETRAPISYLVRRGDPLADQLTTAEGLTPLVEGDRMDGACSVVQSIGGKACVLLGPLLPKLGGDRKSGDSKTEEEVDKKKPEAAAWETEAPAEADPPAEE